MFWYAQNLKHMARSFEQLSTEIDAIAQWAAGIVSR